MSLSRVNPLLTKHLSVVILLFALVGNMFSTAANAADISRFVPDTPVTELVPEADRYGPLDPDLAVAPALKGNETVGWVFLTSDFVSTTGYSGKPIHTLVGIDKDAVLTGVRLVKHSEPIVLIGIPDSEIKAVTEKYAGLDLKIEAASDGTAHELDIISGATVTIMVIDDSIVRAGIKVARKLGLGGLTEPAGPTGPKMIINPDLAELSDWMTLTGDGSVRRMSLDVAQVNDAFERQGDPKAIARPEKGPDTDTYIDMYVALADVPSIGRSLLGDAEYNNLKARMKEGDHAILVLGRGRYSFKGSGYVRGGLFDRIQLIQGDNSVRFFDKQQRRLGELATDDSPSFTELDIFKIPANSEFDPTEPFRIQLLAQRVVGAIDKTFLTFDLGYKLPEQYMLPVAAPATVVDSASDEAAAKSALWQRIWRDKQVEIAVLGVMLLVLTAVFFFQFQATMNCSISNQNHY